MNAGGEKGSLFAGADTDYVKVISRGHIFIYSFKIGYELGKLLTFKLNFGILYGHY